MQAPTLCLVIDISIKIDSGERHGIALVAPKLWPLQVVFLGKRLPYVLAAVSADGCLRLWNVKLMQLLAEVKISHDSLTAVCVDPAQTHLVAADSAGFIHTYSIAAWKGAKGKQAVGLSARCCMLHRAS